MTETLEAEAKTTIEQRLAALEADAKTWYEKHVTSIAAVLSAATALLAGHIFWR
jgi:hypothetical protein